MIKKVRVTLEAIQQFKKMGNSSVFWVVESPFESLLNQLSELLLNPDV